MKFEYARSLVQAWHNDAPLYLALASGTIDLDEPVPDLEAMLRAVGFGLEPCFQRTVMSWMATYFRPVSDMLYDGKSDERAIELLVKLKPVRHRVGKELAGAKAKQHRLMKRSVFVPARAFDKRHDWSTVK